MGKPFSWLLKKEGERHDLPFIHFSAEREIFPLYFRGLKYILSPDNEPHVTVRAFFGGLAFGCHEAWCLLAPVVNSQWIEENQATLIHFPTPFIFCQFQLDGLMVQMNINAEEGRNSEWEEEKIKDMIMMIVSRFIVLPSRWPNISYYKLALKHVNIPIFKNRSSSVLLQVFQIGRRLEDAAS